MARSKNSDLATLLSGLGESRRNDRYSLVSPTFAPNFSSNAFTPYLFQPEEEDMNILLRGMERAEERRIKANSHTQDVEKAIAEQRDKLHQDPETLSWFNKFANEKLNAIKDFAMTGDYGDAINYAIQSGGELVNNAELQGRIKSNERWDEIMKDFDTKVSQGKITSEEADWWKATHSYKHKNITDANGNIVGGELDEPERAVDSLDVNSVLEQISRFVQPERSSVSSSSSVASSHDVDGTGGSSSSSGGSKNERQRLTIERFSEAIESVYEGNAMLQAQVLQRYKSDKYKIEQLKQQLDQETDPAKQKELKDQIEFKERMFRKNAGELQDDENGLYEYFKRLCIDGGYAKSMTYDWRTTERTSSRSTDSHVKTKDPSSSPGSRSYGGDDSELGMYPGLGGGNYSIGPSVRVGGSSIYTDANNKQRYNQEEVSSMFKTK